MHVSYCRNLCLIPGTPWSLDFFIFGLGSHFWTQARRYLSVLWACVTPKFHSQYMNNYQFKVISVKHETKTITKWLQVFEHDLKTKICFSLFRYKETAVSSCIRSTWSMWVKTSHQRGVQSIWQMIGSEEGHFSQVRTERASGVRLYMS